MYVRRMDDSYHVLILISCSVLLSFVTLLLLSS